MTAPVFSYPRSRAEGTPVPLQNVLEPFSKLHIRWDTVNGCYAPNDSDDEMGSTEKESVARAKLSNSEAESSVPVARPADAEARERFLKIEHIARLSAEEQAKQLPHLYRDLARPIIGGLMGMSSYRRNILDPKSSGFPEGDADETWAAQLADAAGEKSPEEMADAIESGNWLKLAARARTLWVFGKHAEAMDKLLQSDLDSEDKISVKRAASTINALKRTSFSEKLLQMYLADDETSKEVWSHSSFHESFLALFEPLLQKVEKDPRLLIRCAGLFQGPLYGEADQPDAVETCLFGRQGNQLPRRLCVV